METSPYNEPWHDEDYEDLDSVLIVHSHEGEPIAKFLQDNLKEMKLNVNVCDITDLESRNLTFHATLILVTPEMVSYLDSLSETFRPDLFSDLSKVNAILVENAVNIEDKAVLAILKKKLPDFESWKFIPLTQTRPTLTQIMHLVDGKSEPPMPSRLLYHLEPSTLSDREKVFILFKSEKHKSDKVVVQAGNREIMPVYHNPYTYTFSPYGLSFGKVQISVSVNGLHQGSTYIAIENSKDLLKQQMGDAFSPIEFLCQVLPLHGSDRNQLEDEIENKMKDNEFAVTMVGNICDTNLSYGERVKRELPTYLHFGAKFGLGQFCKSLRKSQDFDKALTIRNRDGETPSLMAKRMGFTQLSSDLDPAMQASQENQNNTYSVVKKDRREKNPVPPPLPARRNPLNESMKEDRPKQVVLKRSPTDVGSYSKQPLKAGFWRPYDNANQRPRQHSFDDDKLRLPAKSKEAETTVDPVCSNPFPSLTRSFRK